MPIQKVLLSTLLEQVRESQPAQMSCWGPKPAEKEHWSSHAAKTFARKARKVRFTRRKQRAQLFGASVSSIDGTKSSSGSRKERCSSTLWIAVLLCYM